MDTHHIHDEKIGFHIGTSDAREWMRKGLSREGLKDYMREAERGGEVRFKDVQGNKFKLMHNPEDGTFSVHKRD